MLALSPLGIHFIYDTCFGTEIANEKEETFMWPQFIGCTQIGLRNFKLNLFVTESTTTVRKFKVKSRKEVERLMWDLEKFKEVFVTKRKEKYLLTEDEGTELSQADFSKLIPMYGSCI